MADEDEGSHSHDQGTQPSFPAIPPPPFESRTIPVICKKSEKSAEGVLFRLTQAIENDSVDQISELLTSGHITVGSRLSFGVPILLKAIRSEAVEVVDYLLRQGADPVSSVEYLMLCLVTRNRFVLLDENCKTALLKMLPYLNNEQLDEMDYSGKSLLLRACFPHNLAVFEYLLQRGVKLRGHDCDILSALIDPHDCSEAQRICLIKTVLDHPDSTLNITGQPGLHLLCKCLFYNKMKLFFLLLSRGADPFLCTSEGNTLMHFPEGETCDIRVYNQGLDVDTHRIMLLYDLGLDVDATNHHGYQPLENRKHCSWDLLILIVLGRRVSSEDVQELKDNFGEKVSWGIQGMVEKGQFASTQLQSLCRRTIRKSLSSHSTHGVKHMIWSLPLPRPLKLYLDVPFYVKSLLASFEARYL